MQAEGFRKLTDVRKQEVREALVAARAMIQEEFGTPSTSQEMTGRMILLVKLTELLLHK